MADDDGQIRIRGGVVCRHERPATLAGYAEEIEVVGFDDLAVQQRRLTVDGDAGGSVQMSREVGSRSRRVPEDSRLVRTHRLEHATRRRPGHQVHHVFRVLHVQVPEEQAVDDAEQRGVDADADGEDEHGHDGEPRASSHQAGAVANVLPQGLEPVPGGADAIVLARPCHVAEGNARAPAGLVPRNAAIAQPRLFTFEVRTDLVREVLPRSMAPPGRHEAPSGPTTRVMAAANRRQAFAPSLAAARPALVRL